MAQIRVKRGTRAQIEAARGAGALQAGEPYLVTDEARLAVATAPNAFQAMAKQGEGGSASDPLDLATTNPSPPPADTVRLFRKALAGRNFPAFVGPSGLDSSLQESLHANAVFLVLPSSGTAAPNVVGGTLTTAATMSMPALASTSLWASVQRKRFQSAATAGATTGMRTAYTQWWRGNAAGRGGFFFRGWFGQQLHVVGSQQFVGLCASTAALAGEPSALVNMIGMGYDAADTGNWKLMMNDASGVATKIDLGVNAARNATDAYDLMMFCPPHDGANPSSITVEINNLNTGASVLPATTYTSDLPVNTAFMAFKAEVRNGAVASAVNHEFSKFYIGSDY